MSSTNIIPGVETTFLKYQTLYQVVSHLLIKEKRDIFRCIREIDKEYEDKNDVNNNIVLHFPTNIFLPKHGFTIGEFCTMQALSQTEKE